MSEARSASVATGAETYIAALGIAGADQASSNLVTLKTTPFGRSRALNVVASRNIALSDIGSGILTATPAGSVVLTLPNFATLGISRDNTNPIEFVIPVRRGNASGMLFVNAGSGVTIEDPQGLDVQYQPLGVTVCLVSRATDIWVWC